MKVAACTIYSLFIFIYLLFGGNSLAWGATYIVSNLAFIAILSQFLTDRKKRTYNERLFFNYLIFQQSSLSMYTLSCIWASKKWVNTLTPFVAYFIFICFIFTIGYAVYKDEHRY